MELVTIVVGTYNGVEFIETQLKSIVNQSHSNIEIIIVDDASKDDTVAVVNKFAIKHKNIFVHAFSNNVGYIKNFERGINLSNGKFIALADQDDWWAPNKTEKLLANIKEFDLIYCDSEFVDENLKSLDNSSSKVKNLLSSNNPINFLIDNCVSGHAALFKKELFEKSKPFPDLIPHDWWLTFIASTNNGITYFDEPLVKYRHHQNNVIAAKKNKKTKKDRLIERRHRIECFYKACPPTLTNERKIISSINNSYKNFNLINNFKRVFVFLTHQKALLLMLKKSGFKKTILALNMFFKIK